MFIDTELIAVCGVQGQSLTHGHGAPPRSQVRLSVIFELLFKCKVMPVPRLCDKIWAVNTAAADGCFAPQIDPCSMGAIFIFNLYSRFDTEYLIESWSVLVPRHVPRLEFRREECSIEQLQLDDVFETLALERERDTVLKAQAVVEDPLIIESAPQVDTTTVVAPWVLVVLCAPSVPTPWSWIAIIFDSAKV